MFVYAGPIDDTVAMLDPAGLRWRAEFHGQGGNDLLSGGLSDDQHFGDAGADRLVGKGGNDAPDADNDSLNGGLGQANVDEGPQ